MDNTVNTGCEAQQDGGNVLLQMEGISKSFPGVKALDHVSLSVRAGTVHALMGENGARQIHSDEMPLRRL